MFIAIHAERSANVGLADEGKPLHEVTIKVPMSIGQPIEVLWGGRLITEPLTKREILDLLAMALRNRLEDKRKHGDGGNFCEATDHNPPHG